MHVLLKTTDPITVSAATAYLKAEGIEAFVFDVHMSVMEGGIGAFPRRVMVHEEDLHRARAVMRLVEIDTVEEE